MCGGWDHNLSLDHFGCPLDRHSHGTPEVPEIRHQVSLDPASRLAGLLGAAELPVNSRHHQAVARLAVGFKAVAWHRETIAKNEALIEGIEAEDPSRWAFGVQWHPENLVGFEGEAGWAAKRLFAAFAQAARQYRAPD